jgi:hypothetical protein
MSHIRFNVGTKSPICDAIQIWYSTFHFDHATVCHPYIFIFLMPSKKFKPTARNTGPGDVVILSSTSHYTSRGLVEKTKVSKQSTMAQSTPHTSPSKSPKKDDLKHASCDDPTGGVDFDTTMLEPLKLPHSKA